MIGKLFNERYQIIEKLGSGGTAIVYKGQDTLLGRMVTIKILREEYASNEDFVRRFRREAQAVA
ncbi:MAG: protein kinase, partial [Clostridiales bacterium]|nr:protein kinase [Clostridiales bacterium]